MDLHTHNTTTFIQGRKRHGNQYIKGKIYLKFDFLIKYMYLFFGNMINELSIFWPLKGRKGNENQYFIGKIFHNVIHNVYFN